MLRWSTVIPIPYAFQAHSIQIGNHVYFVLDAKRFFVLDIESYDLKEIPCKFPKFDNYGVRLSTSDDQLYMWAHGFNVHKLFKLDRTKMEWQDIITFTNRNMQDDCPIIDNFMYLMEVAGYEYYINIVNLSTGLLENRFLLKVDEDCEWYPMLVTHGGKLYMIDHRYGGQRIVSLIENQKSTIIHTDSLDLDELRKCGWTEKYFQGSIFYPLHYKTKHVYLDTFDFDNRVWSRQVVEKCWHEADGLLSTVKVGDKLIAIAHIYDYQVAAIRVLELRPKLETSCILSIADNLMMDYEVEKVENFTLRLPAPLRLSRQLQQINVKFSRPTFADMMNWQFMFRRFEQELEYDASCWELLEVLEKDLEISNEEVKIWHSILFPK